MPGKRGRPKKAQSEKVDKKSSKASEEKLRKNAEDLEDEDEIEEPVTKKSRAGKRDTKSSKDSKQKNSKSQEDDDDEDEVEEPVTKKAKTGKKDTKSSKESKEKNSKNEDEDEEDEDEDEVEEPVTKKAKTGKKDAKSSKDSEEKSSESEKDSEDEDEEPVAKKAKGVKKDNGKDAKPMLNKTDSDLSKIDFSCKKVNADGEEYNLKICSWNVSGIRAVIKKSGFDYIKKEGADIILLQEVKCNNASLPNDVKLPGYERYFLDSKKQGYCGVAFFSKVKPIKVIYGLQNSTFDHEGRIITAEFENFYVINVYVPNSGSKLINLPKRLDWNNAFNDHVLKLDSKKPVIICGDMNVAHEEIDLTNPKTNAKNAGFSKEEREGLTEFLKEGFVDTYRALYPEKTGAYTFWSYFNNARGRNIGWRLDYFIVSERIKNKICDNVMRDQVYGSDHCPIILYANL